MRTLTRPMFNMGGPIKQGIMNGIREPHASGGRAALVGNPVYPQTGGREHHNVAKTIFGNVGRIANRFNLSGGKGGWWSKIRPTGKFRQVPVPKGYPTGKSRQIGSRFNVSGKGFEGPAPYSKTEMIKNPKLLWEGIKENPYWSGAGGTLALTSGVAPVAAVGAKDILKNVALQAADIAVWDKIWDQDKYFADKKKAADELAKNLEMEKVNAINAAQRALKDTGTAESRANFAKSQRDQRVQKYMDLMGYDRSKKTAIADALIDASKIVSDRGTLDTKNITGELINPAIQALSKRLDKPEQIREAVGLMMTKAGLEKEMYDAKPGQMEKNVQDLMASGKKRAEAEAIVYKQSKGAIADMQSALATDKVSAAGWPSFVMSTGAQHGEEVTQITDEELKEKYKDEDKIPSGMDILTQENITDDGIYIIGQETIVIKGGKKIQIKV